jgi:hypothetical protein
MAGNGQTSNNRQHLDVPDGEPANFDGIGSPFNIDQVSAARAPQPGAIDSPDTVRSSLARHGGNFHQCVTAMN